MDDSIDAAVDVAFAADHGWQKVVYLKRNKKNQQQQANLRQNGTLVATVPAEKSINVFSKIDEQAEERRRRIEWQRRDLVEDEIAKPRSRNKIQSDEGDDSEGEQGRENEIVEEKKVKKPKKEKKPKVSVAEAAGKIDAADLAAFLVDVTESYGSQEEIQLMRFADYFGRKFAGVGSAQFPWVKLFRELPVSKIADIPLSHIPDAVYKTSVEWINRHSLEALNSFALQLLDSILADLASQLSSVKGTKKGAQAPSSKSQVAVFVVLAMVLRRKPDVLVGLLATLKDNQKYQGQDKLPIIIWMVSQASHGDLAIGLYLWAHHLLPILGSKAGNNPLSRDLILQLIERILAAPKARSILVNGAVRKGERLIPPSSLEILTRLTFPALSARLKAAERFEAVYPALKEVALAGTPGSKGLKQVSQQIFSFAIEAIGEGAPALAKEAEGIFIWCLSQSNECFKLWDNTYVDNLEASVAILKKLSAEWEQLALSPSSLGTLKETLISFRRKNEKELIGEDAARGALLRDSDKYCKVLLGRVLSGSGCMKTTVVLAVVLGIAAFVASPSLQSFDWQRMSAVLSSFQS
ncbi:Transmembrane protein 214-B-like protein [Drosera capensis]